MLKAFTLASKNNNDIILNFIKNQVTPKPINLYDGINILMNDFATQQNVIMELLSEEVKKVFFGEKYNCCYNRYSRSKVIKFFLTRRKNFRCSK